MTIQALIAHLGQDFNVMANNALSRSTEVMANTLRTALSTPPGDEHQYPWLQTGVLRDSIEWQSEGSNAVIGSTSDIAFYQEHGTATVPARPTFGPVAASTGEAVAHGIAFALVKALGDH